MWCVNRTLCRNLSKLQDKHPSQDIPINLPPFEGVTQEKVDSKLVLKKLRSFPKGSAAGPTGTRASHLLHAIQVNNPSSPLDTRTDFINHLASGSVPSDVQPFLAGAYVIGLSKKDGGIRSIAIGDVSRKLTGKIFVVTHSFGSKQFFPSIPMCLRSRGRWSSSACLETHHGWISEWPRDDWQKIDFTNAFNSVQRDVFLKKCYEKFPQIYKWVHFCCSQHSFLFFGSYSIPSQAGVFNKATLWVHFFIVWFFKSLSTKYALVFLTCLLIIGMWTMEVFLGIWRCFKGMDCH